ncbi:hypothetical protein DFH11DRAFT_251821 [Phellopilus nigrolimitatus]|nr:hypothetical protein DFH11DRAFT_251821 [Phellopilus nigrolimitatus]
MPVPHRPIIHASRSDEGVSCSGHSLPIGAAQSWYLPFGPPHSTESNLISPPRPRGPISTILDGGANEVSRSRAPGSSRPRQEHFDTTALGDHLLVSSSPHHGTPLYHSGEEMPPNSGGGRIVYPRMSTDTQFQVPCRSLYDPPTIQISDLRLAIDQHRPSFPSPSYPASIPNYPRSSEDSSHDLGISPPRELVSAILGMEGITRGPSHASGRSQHENFGQGVSSIDIGTAGPIGQQPRKSQDTPNRKPCNLCKHWHVRCVVVADELGPLCEQCKKKGVQCGFPKK